MTLDACRRRRAITTDRVGAMRETARVHAVEAGRSHISWWDGFTGLTLRACYPPLCQVVSVDGSLAVVRVSAARCCSCAAARATRHCIAVGPSQAAACSGSAPGCAARLGITTATGGYWSASAGRFARVLRHAAAARNRAQECENERANARSVGTSGHLLWHSSSCPSSQAPPRQNTVLLGGAVQPLLA